MSKHSKIDNPSFFNIDAESALERALTYPYNIAKDSYYFEAGHVAPFDETKHFKLIEGRKPVIGCGSNSSPYALNRKFKDMPKLYKQGVVVGVCTLSGWGVFYSSGISFYGALPATMVPTKDSFLTTAVTFLTDEQYEVMNNSEGLGTSYELQTIKGPLDFDFGHSINEAEAYINLHGPLKLNGQLYGMSAIKQSLPAHKQYDQRTMQQLALEALGLNKTVEEFIQENVANPELRKARIELLRSGNL